MKFFTFAAAVHGPHGAVVIVVIILSSARGAYTTYLLV